MARIPETADELLLRSRESALRVITSALPPGEAAPASYVHSHLLDGELEQAVRGGVQGMFCLDAGNLWMKHSFRRTIDSFLQQPVDQIPRHEMWSIARWLLIEFHEELHGLNPVDPAVAVESGRGYLRSVRTQSAVEGITQLAAETFFPRHLRQMGLGDRVEPLLSTGVVSDNGIYRQLKRTMDQVVDFSADRLGPFLSGATHPRRRREVTARLVADGIGDRGLNRLYEDLVRAAGGDCLDPDHYTQFTTFIADPIDAALVHARLEWEGRASSHDSPLESALRSADNRLDGVRDASRRQQHSQSMVQLRRVVVPALVINEPLGRGRNRVSRPPDPSAPTTEARSL